MQNIREGCGVMVRAEGVRLLELSCLREALEPLLACSFCTSGRLELKEDLNKADKLYSALYLACEMCPHKLQIHTSRSVSEETNSCHWEVNHCTEQLKTNLSIDEELLRNVFQGYGVPYREPVCQNQKAEEKILDDLEGEEGIDANVGGEDMEGEELLESADSLMKDVGSISKASLRIKTYTCLICHQEFRRLGALKQHSSEHSEHETFSCPECMESFQREDDFKMHMKSHGKTNLQCTVCGRYFKKTFNLTQHVRIHTGEKPFLCSICGKSFGDSSTLSKHQKSVHNSERPFSCETCGKTFYHTGHLRVHLRQHTGEKPYSCHICGKAFAYPDSIKKHLLTHTDNRQFQCSVCGRRFRWRESLKQHTKTHEQRQQKQHEQQVEREQWRQHTGGEEAVDGEHSPVTEPMEGPVSVAGTDMVSLTQVIPYLETIRELV
ncbi:zinc finger protein 771 isoform X2 [Cryptotermes secundus]|uniref:zinc finger protein 771 isoform X2 n=1 Tax=Cryptotermes secundus TaxID=105785 RepID=UPI000CD7B5ED|nr:zinc finger protein 771 isoform X2 [Cryptotermes secundus]